MNIRKVIVPAAGWGTSSLPATKNIPKEMLPVYNKPVIQYVVEEAMQAGIRDVVLVTNQNKTVIEDHFDRSMLLESVLEASGQTEKLETVRKVAEMVNIISVRQRRQLGLGHAVLCARDVVGDEPFAVMVGDDLMFGMEPAIKQLMDVAAAERMPVVGVMEVEQDKVSRYGIVEGKEISPGVFEVNDLVEKPEPHEAPSRLAMTGRYVLTPDIFEALEETCLDCEGQNQLTDALNKLAATKGLLAVKMRGKRFDAGDWADYLTANIYFALQDEELRDDLVQQLRPLLPFSY